MKLQQMPSGLEQGLGVQTPPERQVLPVVHRAWMVRRHAPVAVVQQAPGTGHGLGEHEPPVVQACPARPQLARSWTEHVPLETLQQVPFRTHGLGLHTPPCVQALVLAQRDRVVRVHAPVVVQQVPLGGHGLGEHTPPTVQVCEETPHADCSVSEHAPVRKLQHRPGGGGQGLGEHTPPTVHVPEVQAACVACVQAPELQQTPLGCGHGFGLHPTPTVHVRPFVQAACVVAAHAPLEAVQQEPLSGWGHRLGLHEPPCVHVLPPVQLACTTTVHAPPAVQHEPEEGAHGFGEQTPPAAKVPEHSVSSVTEHTPPTQQEPDVPTATLAPVTVTEAFWLTVGPHDALPVLYENCVNVWAAALASVATMVRLVKLVTL
jgi:hypothetical protein